MTFNEKREFCESLQCLTKKVFKEFMNNKTKQNLDNYKVIKARRDKALNSLITHH